MNKTTEALKLAEEALDELRYANDTDIAKTKYYKALAAIREALAEPDIEEMTLTQIASRHEPVKQEPVAWWNGKETAWFEHELCGWQAPDGCTIPLYAAPVSAKREWVELTDDEIGAVMDFGYATDSELAHAVIVKFKEKNT